MADLTMLPPPRCQAVSMYMSTGQLCAFTFNFHLISEDSMTMEKAQVSYGPEQDEARIEE